MNLLRKAVDAGLSKGISTSLDKNAPAMIDTVLNALFNHPSYGVIVGGQLRLMEAGLAPRDAWDKSRDCLAAFLSDEKIKFGNDQYDWSPSAGRTLVEEYEIDHWDSAPGGAA